MLGKTGGPRVQVTNEMSENNGMGEGKKGEIY